MTKIDELYTENDYISDPFDMPPEHDVWLAINALKVLIDTKYFADDSMMEWKINCMINNLKEKL